MPAGEPAETVPSTKEVTTEMPPQNVEAPAGKPPSAHDPIAALVAQLEKRPLWSNGAFPRIELPASAPIEEVVAAVFERVSFDPGPVKRHTLREQRRVRVGDDPRGLIAVLVDTNLGTKIVLLRHDRTWWSQIHDVSPQPLAAVPLRVELEARPGRTLSSSDISRFELWLRLVNESAAPANASSALEASTLHVNGASVSDWSFTFANGPRPSDWDAVPSGEVREIGIGMRDRLFTGPGVYTIELSGAGLRADPLTVTVTP